MTPYHRTAQIQIYHGDCRAILPHLPPVHLIASDVAYGGISGGTPDDPRRPSGILATNDGRIFEHNDIQPGEYAGLFYDVLVDPAHCYVMINNLNLEATLREFRLAGFGFHNTLAWKKPNAVTNKWYMHDRELILFFHKGKAFKINNCSSKTTLPYPNDKPYGHPCEKPEMLMRQLILNSSQPDQVVLDPFCGSGSTLEAAYRTRRAAIGIDLSERWCEVAARRIDALVAGRVEQMELSMSDAA